MAKYRFDEIAINSIAKKKPVEEDKYCYIGLEHLDGGNLKVTRHGSDVAPIGEKLIMKKGDVLFGKRRAYQKKVAIAPFDGIFSAHGMVLRPKEAVISKEFFPLFISSDYFLDRAINISVGSLSPTINWGTLKELEFNLPSINEQGKLAELLWAMNDTREAYKNLLALTDDMIKAKFVEMFGDPERPNHNIQLFKLNDVCDKITDGTHQTPIYSEAGYTFLSSKDVKNGVIDWSDVKYISKELHEELSKRISPRRNDILLAKNGTTGIAALVEKDEVFDIYVSLALLRPKNDINPLYLLTAINSDATKQQFNAGLKGIGVPNLHLNVIKEVMVLIPPITLQDRFADLVLQADKSKLELKRTLDELESVYKSLLHEIFG